MVPLCVPDGKRVLTSPNSNCFVLTRCAHAPARGALLPLRALRCVPQLPSLQRAVWALPGARARYSDGRSAFSYAPWTARVQAARQRVLGAAAAAAEAPGTAAAAPGTTAEAACTHSAPSLVQPRTKALQTPMPRLTVAQCVRRRAARASSDSGRSSSGGGHAPLTVCIAAYCQPGLARGSLQVSHGENHLLTDGARALAAAARSAPSQRANVHLLQRPGELRQRDQQPCRVLSTG